MDDTTNNNSVSVKLDDELLSQVSGGTNSVPSDFRVYLNTVSNPDVKRYINKEINKGDIDTAYRHLYQSLRLDGNMDEAMLVKQLYADTHDGAKIPGLL